MARTKATATKKKPAKGRKTAWVGKGPWKNPTGGKVPPRKSSDEAIAAKKRKPAKKRTA